MSAVDAVSRGRLAQQGAKAARLATLHALRDAINKAGFRRAPLAASSPAIGAMASSPSLTTGYTEYAPASNPGVFNANFGLYTFLGGNWVPAGTTYPLYNGAHTYGTVHGGNGTDPGANLAAVPGTVRFMTTSPLFELVIGSGGDKNYWRLKVDGEYIATPIGDNTANTLRYFTVQFGDGTDSNRQLRRFELEAGVGSNVFFGIRAKPVDRPMALPDPVGLRWCLHGDSMGGSIADSVTDADTAIRAPQPIAGLREALGCPNGWGSSVGGTGFVTDLGNTRSTFLERLPIDILPYNFDFIVEIGGLNDAPGIEADVTNWLSRIVAANPAVAIFMFAPTKLGDTDASVTGVAANKAAAAARFPQNVVFINQVSEGYVFGTGRVGATTGNGNADFIRGTDGTHWSLAGASDYFGPLWARGIAKAVDALIAANL